MDYYILTEDELIEFGFKCAESSPGQKIADLLPNHVHIPTRNDIESEYEGGAGTDYDGMHSFDSFIEGGEWIKRQLFKNI